MKLLGFILAQVMFFSSIAQATEPFAKGARYLRSCEGAMTAINNGEAERFLVDQVEYEEQATQLLTDYGLVMTNSFQEAIKLALAERGYKFPDPQAVTGPIGFWNSVKRKKERVNLPQIQDYLNGVMGLLNLTDVHFQQFCLRVLELLREVKLTDVTEQRAEVSHLMLKRIVEAIDQSPKSESFYAAVRMMVRQVLNKSALHLAWREAEAKKFVLPPKSNYLGWFSSATIGLFSNIAVYQNGNPESGTWFVILIGSTIFSHLFLNGIPYLVAESHFKKEAQKAGKKMDENESIYAYQNIDGSKLEFNIASLFNSYQVGLTDLRVAQPLITLGQASALTSLDSLSPVQILYLGHLEILEVQMMGKALIDKMEALTKGADVNQVRSIANRILDGSADFKDFPALMNAVLFYSASYRGLKPQVAASSKLLKERIEAVQKFLPNLRALVFGTGEKVPNDAQARQAELLWTKLNSDLKSLQTMELDQEKVMAGIVQLEPFVVQLEAISKKVRAPDFNMDTVKTAEEITLIIDGVPQMAGGSQ